MMKNYTIEYGCACTMGVVRKNNEDNFYCDGIIRLDPDSTEDIAIGGKVKSTDNTLFAVFDGMGGEACGEIASFIAASNCQSFCESKNEYNEYIYELSQLLNNRILEETDARMLVLMGTTAAMIQFYKDEIYILNAGDSPIFRLSDSKLSKISKDHVASGYSGKAPLTKFLGTPQSGGLNPYVARGRYKAGDVYVLCTDGITDMIKEEELEKTILSMLNKESLECIAKRITELAKANGGADNATIILCRVK